MMKTIYTALPILFLLSFKCLAQNKSSGLMPNRDSANSHIQVKTNAQKNNQALPKNLAFSYTTRINNQIRDLCSIESREQALPSLKTSEMHQDLKEVLSKMAMPEQSFTFDATIDTIINGTKGTKLYIDANSFEYEDGSKVNGPIKIKLTECYDLPSMISQNLTTTSKGEMIETAGMIKVEAESNGKPVKLKSNSKLNIVFSSESASTGFQLFNGIHGHESSSIDWLPNQEKSIGIWNYYRNLNSKSIYRKVSFHDKPLYFRINANLDTIKIARNKVFLKLLTNHFKEYLEVCARMNFLDTMLVGNTPYLLTTGLHYNENIMLIPKSLTSSFKRSKKYRRLNPVIRNNFLQIVRETPALPEKVFKKFRYKLLHSTLSLEISNLDVRTSLNVSYTPGNSNSEGEKTDQVFNQVFQTSTLGWINCDRFLKQLNQKTDVLVNQIKSENPVFYFMVFEKINSILPGMLDESSKVWFSNIPVNQEVTIFALSTQNDKPILSYIKGSTSQRDFTLGELNEYEIKDLASVFATGNFNKLAKAQ